MLDQRLVRELFKDKTTAIIDHYNKVTGLKVDSLREIPTDVLAHLNHFSYEELRKPFINGHLLEGGTVRQLSRIYNVTEGFVFKMRKFLCLVNSSSV